jgi:hypothetical protein
MCRLLKIAILATVVTTCFFAVSSATGDGIQAPFDLETSILHLITRPQDFDGMRLHTAGYLAKHRGANMRLYLSEDYAKLKDPHSGILVENEGAESLRANECLDQYVWIIGEYGSLGPGSTEFLITRLDEVWVLSPNSAFGKALCWKRDRDLESGGV